MWFFHRKTQTFLSSCASATTFADVDFSILQWDLELDDVAQGIGNIVNMIPPSFLTSHNNNSCNNNSTRNACNGTRHQRENVDSNVNPAINRRQCALFADEENSKKFIHHAFRNKDYPPKWKDKVLCHAYHISGQCPRGHECPHKDTHKHIDDKDYFKKLMGWANGILNPKVPSKTNASSCPTASTQSNTVTPPTSDSEPSKGQS